VNGGAAAVRDSAVRKPVQGFGADLPAFTQAVINISKFLQHNGIFMRSRSAWAYTPSSISRSAPGHARIPRPAVAQDSGYRPILNKAAIARYARTLSTMFSAGVPLVEALNSWPARPAISCTRKRS